MSTSLVKNTTDFFRVLALKDVSQIRGIWKKEQIKLKDEKAFLEILIIVVILSKRYNARRFKLVFDYFAPQFGVHRLFLNTFYDDENGWSLSCNDNHNRIFLEGVGDIEKKITRVGFECYDGFEDVLNYQYPPE